MYIFCFTRDLTGVTPVYITVCRVVVIVAWRFSFHVWLPVQQTASELEALEVKALEGRFITLPTDYGLPLSRGDPLLL